LVQDEPETEHGGLGCVPYRRLPAVHLQLQALFDEYADAGQHPLACSLAPDVHTQVIGITSKAMTPSLQLTV